MKGIVLMLIVLITCYNAAAQSKLIKEVFRKLPVSSVYNLSLATRDSMLAGKTYYPAENDSLEVEAYNYGIATEVNDYMYISMSYETSQQASGMIEIRSFDLKNGNKLIVVSQSSGVWQVTYSQQNVAAFIYGGSKELTACEPGILPAIDDALMMKKRIPAAVKKTITDNANTTFDLSHKRVQIRLNSNYISENAGLRKWLKGDVIYLDFRNDKFVIGGVGF